MQYIKQIVTAINNSIAAQLTDVRFGGSEYNGIVTYAINNDKLMPMLADNYDDNRFIGVDDTFPIRIYHRNNGISYSDVPGNSYGHEGHLGKKEVDNMSVIVYGNRALIRMTPEELEGAIMSGMPSAIARTTLTALKISSCVIKPTSSILDPVLVYATEYRTDRFDLGPNALFIRLNYNIESSYKNSCFNICDC